MKRVRLIARRYHPNAEQRCVNQSTWTARERSSASQGTSRHRGIFCCIFRRKIGFFIRKYKLKKEIKS